MGSLGGGDAQTSQPPHHISQAAPPGRECAPLTTHRPSCLSSAWELLPRNLSPGPWREQWGPRGGKGRSYGVRWGWLGPSLVRALQETWKPQIKVEKLRYPAGLSLGCQVGAALGLPGSDQAGVAAARRRDRSSEPQPPTSPRATSLRGQSPLRRLLQSPEMLSTLPVGPGGQGRRLPAGAPSFPGGGGGPAHS